MQIKSFTGRVCVEFDHFYIAQRIGPRPISASVLNSDLTRCDGHGKRGLLAFEVSKIKTLVAVNRVVTSKSLKLVVATTAVQIIRIAIAVDPIIKPRAGRVFEIAHQPHHFGWRRSDQRIVELTGGQRKARKCVYQRARREIRHKDRPTLRLSRYIDAVAAAGIPDRVVEILGCQYVVGVASKGRGVHAIKILKPQHIQHHRRCRVQTFKIVLVLV